MCAQSYQRSRKLRVKTDPSSQARYIALMGYPGGNKGITPNHTGVSLSPARFSHPSDVNVSTPCSIKPTPRVISGLLRFPAIPNTTRPLLDDAHAPGVPPSSGLLPVVVASAALDGVEMLVFERTRPAQGSS